MKPGEARKLIRQILATGTVLYSQPHAVERLKKHHMTMVDCENVLRGGVVDEPENETASGATTFALKGLKSSFRSVRRLSC
jgi:hypothetical protein